MAKGDDIEAVRLCLASPEDILAWSSGEVTEPTTYHPRSGRPERGGLFCERIFGPVQNWVCRCGKYRGVRHRNVTCERCGTPVLHGRERRRRLGHIDLAAPVVHPWFVKARPSPLALLLGMRPRDLEQVVYGQAHVVRTPGRARVRAGQVLDEATARAYQEKFAPDFQTDTGADAILRLLQGLKLDVLSHRLRGQLAALDRQETPSAQERKKLLQRLRIVEMLRRSGNKPEHIVLRRLAVLPPNLRPMVALESGTYAASELNDLYRWVIHRNNRLKRMLTTDPPERIILSEKRLLQQGVDALFDNQRAQRPIPGRGNRPLQSLTDLLVGKQGRFRGNLLGKRVDYSARAVIVAGPELQLHQCGLPRCIALRLYEPILIHQLMRHGFARTIRVGRQILEELGRPLWIDRTARLIVRALAHDLALEHAYRVLDEAGAAERTRAVENARDIVAEHGSPAARKQSAQLLQELGDGALVEGARRMLQEQGPGAVVRWVRGLLQGRADRLWAIVEEVTRHHPVLLNRAPTLHRPGIQAFEPVLIDGNALRLHPLVCRAFNADFDGDQMAIHLPLSLPARVEAAVLLMSTNNLFNPASGQLIVTPSQDIVLGCFYLTAEMNQGVDTPRSPGMGDQGAYAPRSPVQFDPPVTNQGEGAVFTGPDEVLRAHAHGKVGLHARIRVRLPARTVVVEAGFGEKERPLPADGRLETTVGRVLFNALLPPALPFYNLPLTARRLQRVLADCHRLAGRRSTLEVLERVKREGFRAATRSGLSFACDDLPLPANKEALLEEAEKRIAYFQKHYDNGDLTDSERYHHVIDEWTAARDGITGRLMDDLRDDRRGGRPYLNPVHATIASGARGSIDQVRQLAGMRGLMARPDGTVRETPVKASFREGLSVLEYFSSTSGGRKGLMDKGLRTAEAGYLTRKLIDAAQHVVVRTDNCGTTRGVRKPAHSRRRLADLIRGRVSRQTLTAPGGRVIVREDELISAAQAEEIEALGLKEVHVRSPMTCEAAPGVCRLCYGADLTTGRLAEEGLATGILAAQSIGEPGSQLTLRTFQLGGVAARDIASDLERVTRLLDASPPAGAAVLAPVAGVVRLGTDAEVRDGQRPVWVRPIDAQGQAVGTEQVRWVAADAHLVVEDGARVEAGDRLTEGPIDFRELLAVCGPETVQERLLAEVQAIYEHHRLDIDDKHFEIVLAQMLRKVRVESPGDTGLLPGQLVDRAELRAINDAMRLAGENRAPATSRPHLLGVTRAAIRADSFIAAASFQRTVEVLVEAALAGRVDRLAGLKENVILGRRIPAGTGLGRWQDAEVRLRGRQGTL